MKYLEKTQIDGYWFEREFFSKDMNRIWRYFKKNDKGIRDIYHFIRVIHQEKNGDDFDKPFKCSVPEIRYRSLFGESQTKRNVRVLIALGLVERDHITKKSKDKNKDYDSEAFYKVKKITPEMIQEMQTTKIDALLELEKYKINKEAKREERG